MLPTVSPIAFTVFLIFAAGLLGLSFYLARKAKSVRGYYAAQGNIPWFINGIALAGDYLCVAYFLGICGSIAFYGYDGFLYAIGLLAGWVIALFIIAGPLKRLGKYTFADALDSQFNSRALKISAAAATLVISLFYLIPLMVGAGALFKPLLGFPNFALGALVIPSTATGVILIGVIVILITVAAGMVSTTWVQFIQGALLLICCILIATLVLRRGFSVKPSDQFPRSVSTAEFNALLAPSDIVLPDTGAWAKDHYARVLHADHSITVWKYTGMQRLQLSWPAALFTECQVLTTTPSGAILVNGLPRSPRNDLHPVGFVADLPTGQPATGPLGPFSFLSTLQASDIGLPRSQTIIDSAGKHVIYYPGITSGSAALAPGLHPGIRPGILAGVKSNSSTGRLNFLSFMLALFLGAAVLPHILIRHYTVKDSAAARKATAVAIVAIGCFFILTLYLGLGAMTGRILDPTNTDMAVPLLAGSLGSPGFGKVAFAVICAIAFTAILSTVTGLIMAASGAVVRDLLEPFKLSDRGQVKAGQLTAVGAGILAIILGIGFQKTNVALLVGWAFSIAASANLPAIIMLLFWKRSTRQGITSSILVGLISSCLWIFLSADAFQFLYGYPAIQAAEISHRFFIPFNQPAIVTIPLAFITLVVVSLATRKTESAA